MAGRIFNTGRTGFLYRGNWGAGVVDYRYFDVVLYSDGLYVNINIPGYTPVGTPVSDTTYWKLFLPGADLSFISNQIVNVEKRVTDIEYRTTSTENDVTIIVKKITDLETRPTSLIIPTITPGFSYTSNNCRYSKSSNGVVIVQIRFTSLTTVATPTGLFVLPVGYRPIEQVFAGWSTSSRSQDVSVEAGGTVLLHTSPVGTLAYPTANFSFIAA